MVIVRTPFERDGPAKAELSKGVPSLSPPGATLQA